MVKEIRVTILTAFLTLFSFSFGCNTVKQPTEVMIGNQLWMTENLNVDKFQNGDNITYAKSFEEWQLAAENKIPAYCYYNFDEVYRTTYGKLYNWYCVDDSRGLAPKGYHIPSNDEWQILIDYLGGNKIAGGKLQAKPNLNSVNNEDWYFMAKAGGRCGYYTGFYELETNGYWWSSTESDEGSAWLRFIKLSNQEVYKASYYKSGGYSVRCIRDY